LPAKVLSSEVSMTPAEYVQAEQVLGEQVVLHDSPVFGLILRDDREVVVGQHLRPLRRFAVAHVAGASRADRRLGHERPDRAVDRALSTTVELVIGVLGFDLIPEEPQLRRRHGQHGQVVLLGRRLVEVGVLVGGGGVGAGGAERLLPAGVGDGVDAVAVPAA
jgi:hypothetical protein